MKWLSIVFLWQFIFVDAAAQTQSDTATWDLQKCVLYAMEHNISVRQADLQKRFAALDLHQSKQAQYPSVSGSGNIGFSAGRNQDPTSFSLITTGYVFNNLSLQTSVDVFNWFTIKNTIAANDLTLQARQEGLEKAKNDVALNVAVAYLQALLSKEQIALAQSKLEQSIANLENTRKQVDAGKLPELNAVNLESVVAADSAALINAKTSASQSLLQMKALLNLDAAADFNIATPPVDKIPVEPLAALQPDAVYAEAIQNLPQQKVDILTVAAAQKMVQVARGAMYPTFSLFGSLGTTFNNKATQITGKRTDNSPIGSVTVGGTPYTVFPITPFNYFTYGKMPYFRQLDQNFRQSVGLAISVPIFNEGRLKTAWQRSKLQLEQATLQKEENSFTLKQDIYKAYNDAVAALQSFNANQKAEEASAKAYDFAQKRYALDLLSTFDLITAQNNWQQAKNQLLMSKYDYVFKLKLLEFYKGLGLKL